MLLPPPLVVSLDYAPATAWTSYVTPRSVWTAMPVSIGFSGALPGLEADPVSVLAVAMGSWAAVECARIDLRAAPSTTTLGSEAEDGRNDVLVHTAEWPAAFTVGAAGQTVLYVRGGTIVEADVHLNARDWRFSLGSAPGALDLRSVLTHELGHVLGIGHSELARATMNAGLPSGIAARSLEADDVAAACALYPGGAPTTCATTGCPTGWACVGRLCQRPGEPGVTGGACADGARPCEGAGDASECVATSAGRVCAPPCAPTADCGEGMACVAAVDGRYCLPAGATPLVDAGAGDAATTGDANDAGAGDAVRRPAADVGCAHRGVAEPGGFGWTLAVALWLVRRRR